MNYILEDPDGKRQKQLFAILEGIYKDSPFYDHTLFAHVALVAGIASATATELGGNGPVAYLAGFLHDIGAAINGPEDHHKTGAKIAGEILTGLGYPEDIIKAVQYCLLSHRGSVEGERKTIEAKCVASADGLVHLYQIPSLFKIALVEQRLSSRESGEWVKGKLERSWNKMLPVHQKMAGERYRIAMKILGEALAW
jgi:uncharacterized protein